MENFTHMHINVIILIRPFVSQEKKTFVYLWNIGRSGIAYEYVSSKYLSKYYNITEC